MLRGLKGFRVNITILVVTRRRLFDTTRGYDVGARHGSIVVYFGHRGGHENLPGGISIATGSNNFQRYCECVGAKEEGDLGAHSLVEARKVVA